MKPEIIKTSNFKPSFSDKFFLDTNVWLYLIFPQHSNVSKGIIDQYSQFYANILQKECLIESSIVQISEIVNLILQLEFKQYKKKSKLHIDFKEFRSSENAKEALKNAQTLVNTIAKSSAIRSGNLTQEEIITLTSNIEKADFNDLCFAKHCSNENAILVTHDFDFNALNPDFKIITANLKYL
jgi:predicted nucleic acid-binding protein